MLPGSASRIEALTDVAKVLAASDPDRAERIARSITLDLWKAEALADIAAGADRVTQRVITRRGGRRPSSCRALLRPARRRGRASAGQKPGPADPTRG